MDSQGIRARREWAGSSYTSEHGGEIHSGEHKRGDQDRALDSDEFMAGMIRARPRNDDLWLVEQKVVAVDNLYRTRTRLAREMARGGTAYRLAEPVVRQSSLGRGARCGREAPTAPSVLIA